MENYRIENVSFTYPHAQSKALCNLSITIENGDFVTICGKSGCGKTTLLRLLKSSLTPHGDMEGDIYFEGTPLRDTDHRAQTSKIGFVMQSPDNQIVTDKVWHELAFGLESLGYSTPQIRARVSETASFFGIDTWFHKKVTELSGGQKQLLNLASVMAMEPSVLILDEPTSQLDPIAAQEFLNTVKKINRELGITVILTEHRLEDVFPMSDRVIVMENGSIIADGTPQSVCMMLKQLNHDMYPALPVQMRVYGALEDACDFPLTVRDGRLWIEKYAKDSLPDKSIIPQKADGISGETVIKIKDVYFRYQKDMPDVVKGLSLDIKKGELFAILGGNGVGKTTALSLICGLNSPYRGEVLINGKRISDIDRIHDGLMAAMPQNPQSLFVKKTVYLDLMEMLSEHKISKEEKEKRVNDISQLCAVSHLLQRHPYDLSGGEQQRAALAKVLLTSPQILLLDEPTKGMDAHFKETFACILRDLKAKGITVVMVSHDIEFCAENADRCGLFFDGGIVSSGEPREFFKGKSYYTTAANRMARSTIPQAVLAGDIILAFGGNPPENTSLTDSISSEICTDTKAAATDKNLKRVRPARIILGCIFALLFIITELSVTGKADIFGLQRIFDANLIQIISIFEFGLTLFCFVPQKEFDIETARHYDKGIKRTGRTLVTAAFILLAIPFTIFAGTFLLDDRKYYFISLLVIVETIVPFAIAFENRKPHARELVIISVLCALAVAGRSAFSMLPQFKPVVALVIIAGVCFGGETGFLVGAVTGFVSNFFFGQGPWTPWQMFAFGMIGFFAGLLFQRSLVPKTKLHLCVFGGLATLILYGVIMNVASVILYVDNPTPDMLLVSCVSGLPFDLVHAVSTMFFMWFISEPMIDKLERIKIKYGLVQ